MSRKIDEDITGNNNISRMFRKMRVGRITEPGPI